MLRDHLTNARTPISLIACERLSDTSFIVLRTAGSSLIYMNGCELFTLEYCIHHAFGEESMAAPSTYGAVQGL